MKKATEKAPVKKEKVPVTTAPKVVNRKKVATDTPSVIERNAPMQVVKDAPHIPIVAPITIELKDNEVKMLTDSQTAFNTTNATPIREIQQKWADAAKAMKDLEKQYKDLHTQCEGFQAQLRAIDELQRERLKGMLFGLLAGSYGYEYNDIENVLPTTDPTKIMVILKSDIKKAVDN